MGLRLSPVDSMFHHRIEIVRRAAAAPAGPPATYDAWNALAYGADAVIATVAGRVRPLSVAEQGLLSEAGSTRTDARAYVPTGTDVRAGDRLRKTPTGETYEVRGMIPDPAGTSAFVFVELVRVVP